MYRMPKPSARVVSIVMTTLVATNKVFWEFVKRRACLVNNNSGVNILRLERLGRDHVYMQQARRHGSQGGVAFTKGLPRRPKYSLSWSDE